MQFDELASLMLATAREKGLKIATAESCTGGLISAALTEIAGSSDVFERGFVTYSNAAKLEMLGVPDDIIDANGAVSEEVALLMALGALRASHADLAVSVTGIAGPGGSDHKPEGRVCFGLAQKHQTAVAQTVDFGALGRSRVREETVRHALNLALESLTSGRA